MKTDFEKYAYEKRAKLSTYFELNLARAALTCFMIAYTAYWFEQNVIYLGIIFAIIATCYLIWVVVGFLYWAKERREFTEELQNRLKKLEDQINKQKAQVNDEQA